MSENHTELPITNATSGCACGTNDCADSASSAGSTTQVPGEYHVEGMTCSHCVASVTEELSGLAGVENVTVDLKVGGASVVTISSARPLADDAVRAAVEEAGYTLTSQ